MIRIIHQEFELDITELGFEYQEINHQISEELYSKFSFPIEVPISSVDYLQYLGSFHATNINTMLDCILEKDGELFEAKWEITEIEGLKVIGPIRFGFEEFPNFNKKLSELPLETLSDINIFTTAEGVLNSNYPTTNYNFPMVHTDFYNTESGIFSYFEKVINKRINSAFIQNTEDVPNNIYYNKNIMKPLPHLLYVLSKGFEDAGFDLKGDILLDPEFKRAWIFNSKKVEIADRPENIDWNLTLADKVWEGGGLDPEAIWENSLPLEIYGRFKLRGRFKSYDDYTKRITFNGETILFYNNDINGWVEFERIITTLPNQINNLFFHLKDNNTDDDVMHCEIIPLELYDENGEVIDYLFHTNQIDLRNNVPEMTFGDLVKTVKSWKNLSIEFKAREIWMNYTKNSFLDGEVIDLSNHEVQFPLRKLSSGISYLLKFADISNEEYVFEEAFISSEGISSEDYVKDEKTKEISINAIPLPTENIESVDTAKTIIDDNSKLQIVLYDGLQNGENICQSNTPLLIPAILESQWLEWLRFRIKSIGFNWTFRGYVQDLLKLKATKKIYAYGREHVISKLNRSRINADVEEIEIETES